MCPVVAVSSAVDAFAICVADVAFVHVVPFAIIRTRGSCDNCDIHVRPGGRCRIAIIRNRFPEVKGKANHLSRC